MYAHMSLTQFQMEKFGEFGSTSDFWGWYSDAFVPALAEHQLLNAASESGDAGDDIGHKLVGLPQMSMKDCGVIKQTAILTFSPCFVSVFVSKDNCECNRMMTDALTSHHNSSKPLHTATLLHLSKTKRRMVQRAMSLCGRNRSRVLSEERCVMLSADALSCKSSIARCHFLLVCCCHLLCLLLALRVSKTNAVWRHLPIIWLCGVAVNKCNGKQ